MRLDALGSSRLTVGLVVLAALAVGGATAALVGFGTADAWSGPLVMAAVVLAASGTAKVVDPVAASDALAAIGAPSGVVLVRLLGAGEIAVGVAATVAGGSLLAALVAVAYIGFAVVARRMATTDGVGSCGCFGSSGARPGAVHVVVDAAAALLAVIAAASGSGGLIAVLADTPGAGIPALAGIVLGATSVIVLLTVAAETADAASASGPAPTTFHLVDDSR